MKVVEKIKDKTMQFFASLFMLALVGIFIGLITNFKYTWLSVLCFAMILPAINMWIWQFVEDKKGKKFANKIIIIPITISLFAILYMLNIGNMGIIPKILGITFVLAYFGWIAWSFFSACEVWWQKLLVVLGICMLAIFFWFINEYTVKIETNNFSDIVYMDILEGLEPPIVKKIFIKQNGIPENIDVDYEYEDDDGGERYKVETLTYVRDNGKLYVIFIDEDYNDGYIQYEPADLNIASFLRNRSYIKEKPLKSYTIKINDGSNKELKIIVRKDNKIDSILYYAE